MHRSTSTAALPALVLGIAALGAAAGGDAVVVYENEFNDQPGAEFPEWSSSPIAFSSRFAPPGDGRRDPPRVTNAESPKGRRRFLGEFGGPRIDPTARTRVRQGVRLTLRDLPRHEEATVAFDLLVLKSWDGNSPQYGPDRWSLGVKDGPTLLDTTFSNNPKVDAEGTLQDYPRPRSRPHAGARGVDKLGYTFFGDSLYHFELTFPHEKIELVLEFASDLFEGKGTEDESWGLDNVKVQVWPKARARPVATKKPGQLRGR
jgi:hypothetical protein